MQSLEQSYAHISYQGYFEIKNPDKDRSVKQTFSFAASIVHSWIWKKFPKMNVPRKPCTFHKDYFAQSVSVIHSYDQSRYCMMTKHLDSNVANRIWITEAEIAINNGVLSIAVRNQYTSSDTTKDPDLCTPPGFVNKLAGRLILLDGGEQAESLTVINSDESLTELHCLIIDSLRQLPVIVISSDSRRDEMAAYYEVDEGYHIDGNKLAEKLKYLAHVYYLPVEYQNKWREEVGDEFGVLFGAVRTYYPGFDADEQSAFDHPYIASSKILRMSYTDRNGREIFAGHAYRHILTKKIRLDCMYARVAWEKLGVDFYLKIVLKEKNRKEGEKNEYLDLVEQDNELKEQTINQLSQENKTLEDQLKKARAVNIINQNRISQLKDQLKEYASQTIIQYPDNYEDLPEWIENNFAGRITLHSRARRALKNATYQNVELVCKVIEVLGDTYYKMRNSEVGREEFEKALSELRVEESPSISQTRAGQFGDEYYVNYNGRRCFLERHIKEGVSRDQRDTFRLYYFWDDDNKEVVIGYLPDHLKTSIS